MSEQEEPSYYEIALTNRQVLVAFVILLGCMLAAFFAGVWVGKGNAAPPQVVTTTTPAEQDPLRKFSFFEQGEGEQNTPAGGQEASRPAPPPPAPPPPAIEELSPEELGADDDLPLPFDEEPAPEPEAPSQAAPPPPPSAPGGIPRTTARRQPPEPTGKELFIQVFSTHDQDQASRVRRRLNDNGYSAFLSPVEVDNRTMYRVRIGPFTDRTEAERVAAEVKESFKLDTWITGSA